MITIDGIIFSLQNSGGISVYYNELLKYTDQLSECYQTLIYENKNPYASKLKINKHVRGSLNIERFLRCEYNSEDPNEIFHSSYYRLPDRKFKGKIITTIHDFTDEIYPRNIKAKLLSWQKMNAILKSDGLICISENTKKDLLRFIPEAKKIPIRVIYNGVSDFKFNNIIEPKTQVIFVGARNGYKNFEICVNALEQVGELELVIVGGGDLSHQEIKNLNELLPGRYKKLGFVSETELNNLYSKAFCLFYPSSYEGFGIPVIEAMKSGCPVIAANHSSIGEVSGDAALLVDNINHESFVKELRKLFDEEFRSQLISSGLKNSERFSWKKCVSETIEFYNEIRSKR